MNKMDIYYGALVDYRKSTRENNDCARQRKYISHANADDDRIEVVTTECDIDDDWIIAIEKGLEFIDKAIKEERQFILSNGEVVPVEKVKNVSKESVEHLAKHSNLVSRLPAEGNDLIPDKLYTVERLTDYAVYENRFLYMLLCYLRDFISLRYNSILELVTTYSGKMYVNKQIAVGDRKTTIRVELDEHLKNDAYLREHNASKEKIDRIDGLLKGVISFLAHPLMEEVSKAPMLKPPITETNVLKMNKNFKGAMQLYYFVTAYTKKGYTPSTSTKVLNPFKEHVSEEVAELVELTSFMTYQHGMGIEGDLKAAYEERLKKQREEEQLRKLEQLKALRKRVKEYGENPEEYMLMLEQRNRLLEADSAQLARARIEIKSLQERIAEMVEEINGLKEEVADLKAQLVEKQQEIERMIEEHAKEIAALHEKYQAEIAALHEQYQAEIAALHESYKAEIAALHEKYQEEIASLIARYEAEIADLTERYEERLSVLTTTYEEKLASQKENYEKALALQKQTYEERIVSLTAAHQAEVEKLVSGYESQVATLKAEREAEVKALTEGYERKLAEAEKLRVDAVAGLTGAYEEKVTGLSTALNDSEKTLASLKEELRALDELQAITAAKLNGLKKESGLYEGGEDYVSREGFDEIERQYKHFKAFFKEQWRLTKKDIRKKYLKAAPKQTVESEEKKTESEKDSPTEE